jgi:hypothetical protein
MKHLTLYCIASLLLMPSFARKSLSSVVDWISEGFKFNPDKWIFLFPITREPGFDRSKENRYSTSLSLAKIGMVRKRKNRGTGAELQRFLGQPLGNSLVFHHSQPIETFAQRVSV